MKIIRRKRITIRQHEMITFKKNEVSNEVCPVCHSPIHKENSPNNEIRQLKDKTSAAKFKENE